MAETILVELLETIVEKVGSKAYNKIMSAKDINTQVRELESLKLTLEAALLDADSSLVCTHSQRDVLEKIEHGLAKIIHFQDVKAAKAKQQELMKGGELTKKVRTFFSPSNQLVTSFRDAKKIRDIRGELSLIAKDYSQFGTIIGSSSVNKTRILVNEYGSHMSTDLVFGRDKDRDNMVGLLLDPSTSTQMLSVVSIVGMGGIGKSTLAQYVCKDQRVKSSFDSILWVSTTQEFNVKDVIHKILASIMDERPLDCEMDQLQRRLFREIGGRKFLLVLDGVWDNDSLRAKWLELRSLLWAGAQGSKILLTTRNDTVAIKMDNHDPYMLSDLQEEECWLLFQHIACTQGHEPGVNVIGKEIAKMCPKVPLVLMVIGSLLAGKLTVQEWGAFKNDQLTHFALYGRNIMGTLKLSYDELGEGLKLCVTFCSLFPKRLVYKKHFLIRLWIAMGYVKPEYANQSLEDAAEGYVLCLTRRGFFQHWVSDSLCMHNLMHDLVVSIAGFKYKVADPSTVEFDERVCHVSYWPFANSCEETWKVPSSLFKIKQLQSFLLPVPSPGFRFIEHEGIFKHDVFLSRFQSLRSLRIHGLGINKLPKSVGDLIQLRYLDVSNNPIRRLPTTITHLVNLYLLNLSYCKNLEELPRDISKLVMLRHLSLHGCDNLSHMPKGLGNLRELETLDRFVVNNSPNGSKTDFDCGLAYLNQLDNLKGLLILFVISQSKDMALEAKAAKMQSKENISKFYIKFRDSTKLDEVMLNNLQPNVNLRNLGIMNYKGERLPRWMKDELHRWLPNLVEIHIRNCKGSKHLCSFGRLSHLRFLELEGMEDVEYIENDGGIDTTVAPVNDLSFIPLFPSLTGLILLDMPKLKGWYHVDETIQASENEVQHHLINRKPAFPRLRSIRTDMAVLFIFARMFLPGIASLNDIIILGKQPELIVGEEEIVSSTVPAVNITNLPNLTYLMFLREYCIKDLPVNFRDMSSLKKLTFVVCKQLEALPEWIGNFTSLEVLYLDRCPKLASLPLAIGTLSNLKSLYLLECSTQLAERCREPMGEDWPIIQHIPSIDIKPAHDNASKGCPPKLFFDLDEWYDVVDTVF